MNTEDDFSYQPLRLRSNEIRLLRLNPVGKTIDGAGYSPIISCTLRRADLDDAGEYDALSYVWGNRQEKKPILIDGKIFHVTVNLEAALRQLAEELRQRRSSHVWLWVDAVCIDQSDLTERTHQVCHMSSIYRNAAQVMVWLGPGSSDSELAMATLRRIDELAEQSRTKHWVRSWPMYQFRERPLAGTSACAIQAALDAVLELLCADRHRALEAVASLYERPWFRRVWVIQEIALSRSAVLCCGDTTIAWPRFYAAFWMLCGLRDYLNSVVSPRAQVANAVSVASFLNAKLENVGTVAFSWVLANDDTPLRQFLYFLGTNADHSRLQASDERDYCFALLGLAKDTQLLQIYANYEASWKEVKVRMAKSCLRHYGLEVLSFCNLSASKLPEGAPDSELAPSWVPDWASPHLPKALSVYSHLNVRGYGDGRAYSASGSLRQSIDESSFDTATRLRLWAIRVGHVVHLGDGLSEEEINYKSDADFQPLAIWVDALRWLLPHVNEVYDTEKKVLEALWRTPIADRAYVHNYETTRAPADLQTGYKDLLDGRQSREAIKYAGIAQYKLNRRRPFRTSNGFIGIGPTELDENDVLWILLGADVPFALRDAGDGCFHIVGETYVHGIMDGELTQHQSVQIEQIQIA